MDLFTYYREQRDARRMRQAMREIKDSAMHVERTAISDACKFITRKNDFEQVRDMNIGRYAMTLVDSDGGADSDGFVTKAGKYEPYLVANHKEAAKFYSKIYETACTGVAQTICSVNANLFTSWEQTWKFVNKKTTKKETGEEENTPSEDVENLINIHREYGLFDSRIVEVDYLASAVDSALLHIYMKGEDLAYDTIWTSSVYLVFGQSITETTSRGEIPRPIDYTDLEDASAVILCIGGYSTNQQNTMPDKKMFLAYVGGNADQPLGRMVQYVQDQYWPIPDPGDDKITYEYTRGDNGGAQVMCNPLTYLANRRGKRSDVGGGYEYPLVVIRGDQTFGASDALPTTTTFYQNCIEIESAWSQILRQGVKAARGKDVITLPVTGEGELPDSLDIVVLKGGMTYQYFAGNASGVAQAIETTTSITRGVAASRGVPPYVIVGSAPSQPESGIALALRTQPLIDTRNRRIAMNRSDVAKIYCIESGLLTEAFPELESKFNGVRQQWNPGRWQVPKDDTTMLADLLSARTMEVIDHVETVRVANGLRTAEDAESLISTFEDRDPYYKSKEQAKQEPPKNNAPPVFGNNGNTEEDQQRPR